MYTPNCLTHSNSSGANITLRDRRSGTMNMMKKGKKRAACVDFTAQRIPSPKHWQIVKRCIFNVLTYVNKKCKN